MDAVTRRALTAFAVMALAYVPFGGHVAAQTTREVPMFEPDPSWPKLPSKYVWGQVSSVSIDNQGHAWILQRPSTVRADQKSKAAPPVLEFDEAGNFVQGWGGPGAGYDWPETEHGIYVDPKGFVWLGGNGRTDHHLVKFTKDGKFVMQIGHKGQSKGNKDTQNVNMAADTFVYAKTNELFVADGYGNKRVIVFDPDTGAFKRMWGAFGNEPLDNVPAPPKVSEDQRIPAKEITGPGPDQFVNPVHAVRVSNDGLVYVSDRGGKRVQVFTLEGKYVNQVFIDRYCEAPHCGNGQTVASTAFSATSTSPRSRTENESRSSCSRESSPCRSASEIASYEQFQMIWLHRAQQKPQEKGVWPCRGLRYPLPLWERVAAKRRGEGVQRAGLYPTKAPRTPTLSRARLPRGETSMRAGRGIATEFVAPLYPNLTRRCSN